MVIAQGHVILTNKGSWTSGVRFTGLPFTTTSTVENGGSVTLSLTAYDGTNLAPYIISSSTRFYIGCVKD